MTTDQMEELRELLGEYKEWLEDFNRRTRETDEETRRLKKRAIELERKLRAV
jgi:hypothetical protein